MRVRGVATLRCGHADGCLSTGWDQGHAETLKHPHQGRSRADTSSDPPRGFTPSRLEKRSCNRNSGTGPGHSAVRACGRLSQYRVAPRPRRNTQTSAPGTLTREYKLQPNLVHERRASAGSGSRIVHRTGTRSSDTVIAPPHSLHTRTERCCYLTHLVDRYHCLYTGPDGPAGHLIARCADEL